MVGFQRRVVGLQLVPSLPRAFRLMNQPMAIPTHRLEILDLVGTTVRAVPPVMVCKGRRERRRAQGLPGCLNAMTLCSLYMLVLLGDVSSTR
jgi:hypothetical protein